MITVFSFGAGQESIFILYKLATDKDFYNQHVKGELIVVGADTGNEHDHTYLAVKFFERFCLAYNINFYWVTPDMGCHPKTWQSLTFQYEKNDSIGSAAFQQTCTDNLKVKVVNNFVEKLLMKRYNYQRKNKKVYHYHFAQTGEQIRLILGFAKGEESRTAKGNTLDPLWKKKTMVRYYPLIEAGVDRQHCIDFNEKNIEIKIYPSNCMMCFYQSDQEILWLYRNKPEVFKKWVELEANKLKKYQHKEKNYGVYGKLTLLQKLDKAQKLYGDWSDERLDEYKYSHGHCIKSKY